MPYARRRKTYRNSGASKSTSTRKVSGRKRVYRRRAYKKIKPFGSKWLYPLSQAGKYKFVYADTGFSARINLGSGFAATYLFRGNGPYDPDFTGVGVQPYGWDQVMGPNQYSTYACPASACRIYFRAGTNTEDVRRISAILVPVKTTSYATTDISDLRMAPYHKETMYDNVTETTRGAKLKNYCSTKRLFTDSKVIQGNNVAYNAAPSGAYSWYWQIIFTVDGTNDDLDFYVYFDVKIAYYTMVSRAELPNES